MTGVSPLSKRFQIRDRHLGLEPALERLAEAIVWLVWKSSAAIWSTRDIDINTHPEPPRSANCPAFTHFR
jgi:hypothetical protein